MFYKLIVAWYVQGKWYLLLPLSYKLGKSSSFTFTLTRTENFAELYTVTQFENLIITRLIYTL
jgi:hypothetical protein